MSVRNSSTTCPVMPAFLPSTLPKTMRSRHSHSKTLLPSHSTIIPVTPRMTLPPPDRSPSNDPDSPPGDDMHVYRKSANRQDSSDLLPFDVEVITPPPRSLGCFRLDPRTHCGDIVEHAGLHFLVKSVRMQYKYSAGAYRVVKKTIEVKSLARKAIEVYLERVMNDS